MKKTSKIVKAVPKQLSASTAASKKHIEYDKDFFNWTKIQVDLLKNRSLEKLDIDNLIEEIESLGKSDKRALKNHLINLLKHLLKIEYQPQKHTKSWDKSVANARLQINLLLEDSPSLKQELKNEYKSAYEHACKKAAIETGIDLNKFANKCPWKLADVLEALSK